jgi:hypothetical protein
MTIKLMLSLRLSIILFFAFTIIYSDVEASSCAPLEESFFIQCTQGKCEGLLYRYEEKSRLSHCGRTSSYREYIDPEITQFLSRVLGELLSHDAEGIYQVNQYYWSYHSIGFHPSLSYLDFRNNFIKQFSSQPKLNPGSVETHIQLWVKLASGKASDFLKFRQLPDSTTQVDLIQQARTRKYERYLGLYLPWLLAIAAIPIGLFCIRELRHTQPPWKTPEYTLLSSNAFFQALPLMLSIPLWFLFILALLGLLLFGLPTLLFIPLRGLVL